jgi:hypothetical protein
MHKVTSSNDTIFRNEYDRVAGGVAAPKIPHFNTRSRSKVMFGSAAAKC